MIIKIGERDITIYTEAQLLKAFVKVEEIPPIYLKLGVMGFYAYWRDNDSAWSWLEIAGRETGRIDLAVPQSWWDEYHRIHNEPPKACWSYEQDRYGGRPLMWDEVREQVRAKIAVAVKRMINQMVGEGTL
jgi:hypothetical protein